MPDEGMTIRSLCRFEQRRRAAVCAAVAALALAACQRQQPPETMLAADQGPRPAPLPQPASDVRRPPPSLPRWIAQRTPDATPDKVKDAAISAAVASALTREPTLNGFPIAVDSASGCVILVGLAPDPVARSRATELASHVEGVVVVQNQLGLVPVR